MKGREIRKPEKQAARPIASGRSGMSAASPAPSASDSVALATAGPLPPELDATDRGGVSRLLDTGTDEATSGRIRYAAFRCDAVSCVGRHPTGAAIVYSSDAEEARRACTFAALIVLDDATTPLKCADKTAQVITKRELARSGSVAVSLPASAGLAAEIRHAIGKPDRPWHRHRIFSREARGLPPRQRRKP
jgi:competence protein ComEC